MKLWIKFFLGAVLGLVLGCLLPLGSGSAAVVNVLAWLAQLAVRMGRYAVPPLMLFALILAFYQLRQERRFLGYLLRAFILLVCLSVAIMALGLLVILVFPPPRIPIRIETQTAAVNLDIKSLVDGLVPSNMLSILVSNGVYLLPLGVLALIVAAGLFYNQASNKSIVNLIDSLARVFYHVINLIQEILGPVMIMLAAYWAVCYRSQLAAGAYGGLILLLLIFGLVLVFGLFPALLLLLGRVHPWRQAYALLSAGFAAFFSGDVNFSLAALFPLCRENMSVNRKANAPSLLLFSVFCRCGSGLVAAIAFIVAIKSYSSLEITLAEALSIGLRALLVSFLLAGHPGDGAWTALAVIAASYGRGFESAYLILKPLSFFLISMGTFIDVMLAGYANFALATMTGNIEDEKSIKQFI
jgi:Na+/H+-dicarboxylate symporter